MQKFLDVFGGAVNGVLVGLDRMFVRGSVRWLSCAKALAGYLGNRGISLNDFGKWSEMMTSTIRRSCEKTANDLGVPAHYLSSSAVSKEEFALGIAAERRIDTGPICMLSAVEPCWAPTICGSRLTKHIELEMRQRKCVWIYFYFNDPRLGFGHLRVATWAPYPIKGCLNGRHWLERSLVAEKIDFVKSRNCMRWVADAARAQQLLDDQLRTDWPGLLNGLTDQYFPAMRGLLKDKPLDYYWSFEQTELATDLMFGSTAHLDRLFPMLSRHAVLVSDSPSIKRYLGQIEPLGKLGKRVPKDLRSERIRRHEGICVKHYDNHNSVKTYNKAGNVLRVETTIANTLPFKVYRQAEPGMKAGYKAMRKGVADMHRRCEISKASNERYLDMLAATAAQTTLGEQVEKICLPARRNKRRVRAMNPCSPDDLRLFQFLSRGEWAINGFRNADLARWIESAADKMDPQARHRLSCRTSYLIGILRAHKLIHKVPKSNRYQISPLGRRIAPIVIAASNAKADRLMDLAA